MNHESCCPVWDPYITRNINHLEGTRCNQTPIGIALDGLGVDFRFLLLDPSLLFALFTIFLMSGFQERLFDMSMPRCVATGTALSDSSCIVYGLSMGDLDMVMCIILHLEELKVICQVCSQSISLPRSCWSVLLLIFR